MIVGIYDYEENEQYIHYVILRPTVFFVLNHQGLTRIISCRKHTWWENNVVDILIIEVPTTLPRSTSFLEMYLFALTTRR